jgi:predicted  nucleic acid-binding Zn ribbon protein
MYILFAKVLNPMQKDNNRRLDKTVGGEREMRCPDCNSEMKIEKESGYMKQYRCDVCRRVETLWTVCVTA